MVRKKIVIGIAVVIGIIISLGAGCSGKAEKTTGKFSPAREKPIAVKTAVVAQGNINPTLEITGLVAGEKEIELTAKTQGTITSLTVRTGEHVSTGQVVAVLENENQQLTVAKAKEQVTAARLNLEKAQIAFNRANELYKQEAVSQAEYENALYMLQSAQVAYNVALSDSQLAEKLLNDTVVVAPFSGSVIECSVEKGQTVFPGKEIMTIVDDSNLKIKANLDADQLKLVWKGQRGVFTTSVFAGKEFDCTVTSIATKANPANLTYTVELHLSGDARRCLKPGMFGHVKLRTAEIKRTVIPREAIITLDESGNAELFVVKNGKALSKKIKTGESDVKNIAVVEGLKPGDKVVTFGQNLLRDGILVTEGE